MSFLDWLTLLFVYLKLTGHIDWSWFFVVLPFLVVQPLLQEFIKWADNYKKKH